MSTDHSAIQGYKVGAHLYGTLADAKKAIIRGEGSNWKALYFAAPPPPDQVLSDEEIQAIGFSVLPASYEPGSLIVFARAIERAVLKNLGAKNV